MSQQQHSQNPFGNLYVDNENGQSKNDNERDVSGHEAEAEVLEKDRQS